MLLIDKIAYENRLIELSPGVKSIFYLCLLALCFLAAPIIQVVISVIVGAVTVYVAKVKVKR